MAKPGYEKQTPWVPQCCIFILNIMLFSVLEKKIIMAKQSAFLLLVYKVC